MKRCPTVERNGQAELGFYYCPERSYKNSGSTYALLIARAEQGRQKEATK